MFTIKRCPCGCGRFEKESDDDVLRCEECGSLARIVWVDTNNCGQALDWSDTE